MGADAVRGTAARRPAGNGCDGPRDPADGPVPRDDGRAAALASAEEDLWEAYIQVHRLGRSAIPVGRTDVRSAALRTESALDRLRSVAGAGGGR